VTELVADMPGRAASFGFDAVEAPVAFWLDAGRFAGRFNESRLDFGSVAALAMPGQHARLNALAAIAAATLAGVPAELIARGIPKLTPVADRLEPVARINSVEYVNDTTATAPVAAIAALQAYGHRPVVAIAGGSEKHISLEDFARELVRRAEAVVLLDGGATPGLLAHLKAAGHPAVFGPFSSMSRAVSQAAELARPGGVVLLSPGCASFGMFRNEFDRGRQFKQAVELLRRGELRAAE
jgi:UDP-N-acetylmuramoylalanine--D-glutamate ligase